MASKKYLFLLGAALVSASAFAQEKSSWQDRDMTYRGAGYDVYDTTLLPKNRQSQQREFLNNQYDFPAKPRNQWEIGINGGMFNVIGDVRSKTPFTAINPMQSLGFGATVRKAFGYVLSGRLQYMYGVGSGYNWEKSAGFAGHDNPWNTNYNTAAGLTQVHYNYKTNVHELSAQLVASFNNIRFHKARNKFSLYGFIGGGAMMYNTKVDALDASNNPYKFDEIPAASGGSNNYQYPNRKDVNTKIKDMVDGKYESQAERYSNAPRMGESTVRPVVNAGLGMQFKLGKRLSLTFEDKISIVRDDLLDGVRWAEQRGANTISELSPNNDMYNYGSVGLAFNIGSKSVAPLWWMNPMDYAYNELNAPRHMKLPKPVLEDSDGDGVVDQFDLEPNTPQGAPVDSHGVSQDTDGDGVPDFRDKQLITPTECQPVDADGVGKCPDPECCKGRVAGCGSIRSFMMEFPANSAKMSKENVNMLGSLASDMKANPDCKVIVSGYGSGSKYQQQRSWDRVNGIIDVMADKYGVDRNRFIFRYGQEGNPNTVELRSANGGENGDANVPPPFPNLRSK